MYKIVSTERLAFEVDGTPEGLSLLSFALTHDQACVLPLSDHHKGQTEDISLSSHYYPDQEAVKHHLQSEGGCDCFDFFCAALKCSSTDMHLLAGLFLLPKFSASKHVILRLCVRSSQSDSLTAELERGRKWHSAVVSAYQLFKSLGTPSRVNGFLYANVKGKQNHAG